MAARLAIACAQRQLAVEAGVHLHVRNFQVINTASTALEPLLGPHFPCNIAYTDAYGTQVGAASLRATFNCEAFAEAHRSESHFDRESFVGLAVNFKATLDSFKNRSYPPLLFQLNGMFVCVCAQWRPPGESNCVGALAHRSRSHVQLLTTLVLCVHRNLLYWARFGARESNSATSTT